ncbi:MAG TPA: hypothetical protein VD886_00995 [Herpetosiphonaceae bacterium]|nr:hypothetical protein [Herpetosiphonaceae bacterium]
MSGKGKIYGNKRWVGLMFAAVMLAAGGTCAWMGVASAQMRVDGWWMPLLMGFIALAAGGGSAGLMINEWRHERPLAARAVRRFRLRPDSSALMKFLAWLGLALVANLFINAVMIALVLKGPATPGRLACLALFWIVFAVPSLAVIVPTVRQGRLMLRGDRTESELSRATLRLGDQASVSISHRSRVNVHKITVKLLHQEHKRTQQRLVARTLHERMLGERRRLDAAECQPWEHSFPIEIPASGQPSGRAGEYEPFISWDIVVEVQPAGRPAYEVRFPLTVIS